MPGKRHNPVHLDRHGTAGKTGQQRFDEWTGQRCKAMIYNGLGCSGISRYIFRLTLAYMFEMIEVKGWGVVFRAKSLPIKEKA